MLIEEKYCERSVEKSPGPALHVHLGLNCTLGV